MNVFKKPIFYIVFFLTFFIGLKVSGWDFLGIWTSKYGKHVSDSYVKTDVVDDTCVKIVFLAADLSNGRVYQYQLLKDSISLLHQAKLLIKLNVLDYLKNSSSRQISLENLLIRLSYVIDNIEQISSELLSKINYYNTLYNQCISQKNLGDSQYFEGLRNFDYETLVNGLVTSANGGGCAETNRIYAKGYKNIYSLLQKYKYLLEIKYNILNNNQDLILQNIYLFEGNYLDKLLELKKQLTMISY